MQKRVLKASVVEKREGVVDVKPYVFSGVYTDGKGFYTLSLAPGYSVYGEKIVKKKGKEYRLWNPRRSKLSAFLHCGGKHFPFKKGSRVLYLGAATGTTVSHVSDIVREGVVFAVEFSPLAFQRLLELASVRPNVVPLLADARLPRKYRYIVGEVDVLYQDVSQRDQTDIFIKNATQFLVEGGKGMLMLKTRSIDVSEPPARILGRSMDEIKKGGFEILETVNLSPYQRDHYAIVVRKTGGKGDD